MDLLNKYRAPNEIGFLSIDTEGSEFEIMRDFNFSSYNFGFVAIEHNHGSSKDKIKYLFEKNGYRPVFEDISDFDSWFVSIN
jgi:hypothetical protein